MLQVLAFGLELGYRLDAVLVGVRCRVRGAQSAGMCARRRRYFSLLRQRKVPKRKTALLPATPALPGQPRCSTPGRRRGTRCAAGRSAQTAAADQSTKRVRPAAHPPAPGSARLGAGRRAGSGSRASGVLCTAELIAAGVGPGWAIGQRDFKPWRAG